MTCEPSSPTTRGRPSGCCPSSTPGIDRVTRQPVADRRGSLRDEVAGSAREAHVTSIFTLLRRYYVTIEFVSLQGHLEVLATRVAMLEERLTRLEANHGGSAVSAGVPSQDGPIDPETFWALNGLKARVGGASAVLFTGSVTLPTAVTYVWQQGVDAGALLETEWDFAADPLSALGHPVRLVVLREVLRGQQTTAELGAVEGFGTTGQLYHHLRLLVAAGWLRAAGRGRYEVPAARVVPLLAILAAANPAGP